MRLIFKLIVVGDVFVVLAGLFFIFDKIMRNRNIELVNSFSSRMEVLQAMNSLIQKIKDESSEMELISLNAMVVSIKSGKEGQAFSYITSNLKQLSLRLIAQSDALIANLNRGLRYYLEHKK